MNEPAALHERILAWYDEHARDLPWRSPSATPWGILVSEFMLQQTPVARVLPVWSTWMDSWPTPADLVDAGAGEAVRAWGKLGYPRRALRLHAAAAAIVAEHAGEVPSDYHRLIGLPGVGDYTAAAVASFAFRQRHVVLDTNVRRVFARAVAGVEFPAEAVNKAERELATSLLPDEPGVAANWAVGVMELGALVCIANAPRCDRCPVSDVCCWVRSGKPPHQGPPRKVQSFAGTDRQCRGRLLDVLRADPAAVPKARLDAAWSETTQRERCLTSLVTDGLVVAVGEGFYSLPG